MWRKSFLLVMLAVGLAACAGNSQPISMNKTAVISQLSAGVAFNTGAVLVSTCVIKKDTAVGRSLDASFKGVAAAFDSANVALQAGITDPTIVGLNLAIAALQQAQGYLASANPTPVQAKALRTAAPKAAALSGSDIGGLIQVFLPILLSAAPDIVALVQSFSHSVDAPSDVTSLASVAAANTQMHSGLVNWTNAQCVQ